MGGAVVPIWLMEAHPLGSEWTGYSELVIYKWSLINYYYVFIIIYNKMALINYITN